MQLRHNQLWLFLADFENNDPRFLKFKTNIKICNISLY